MTNELKVDAHFGRDSADLHELAFRVDTSSFYTIVPPALVAELKLPAMMKASVSFRGQLIPGVRIGVGYLRLMEREGGVPFGVLEVAEPLLGSTALEALGLRIDDAEQMLEYSGAYGAGALLLDEEDF